MPKKVSTQYSIKESQWVAAIGIVCSYSLSLLPLRNDSKANLAILSSGIAYGIYELLKWILNLLIFDDKSVVQSWWRLLSATKKIKRYIKELQEEIDKPATTKARKCMLESEIQEYRDRLKAIRHKDLEDYT